MPEGAHPLPPLGWAGLPFVDFDGENWPLPFAAELLGVSERVLRERVRVEGVEAAGVIRMAGFRRSGRQPRAYPAGELVRIAESIIASQRVGGEKKVSGSG